MLNDIAQNPLYMSLYLKLYDKIVSGEYPAGFRLPSEKELAEQYGVSRITSRHALNQLADKGIIRRYPGKGSFVQGIGTADDMMPMSIPARAAKLIGIVLEGFRFQFGAEILQGIEQQCAEAGYAVLIKFSGGEEERERKCIDELLAIGVSGILMMAAYSEVYSSTIMRLSLDGFPLVFLDRSLQGLPVPCVRTDHRAAAAGLTDELIAGGHQQLVLVMTEGSQTTSSVGERIAGYMESCMNHNLLCANARLMLQYESVQGPDPEARRMNVERTKAFLKENPEVTGIVALTAGIAEIVFQALSDMDEGHYAVASFDGPENTMFLPFEHCYVEQDQNEIGRVAAKQLLAKIGGQDVPLLTHVPHLLRHNRTGRMPEC